MTHYDSQALPVKKHCGGIGNSRDYPDYVCVSKASDPKLLIVT
jgi:hypothetical protein